MIVRVSPLRRAVSVGVLAMSMLASSAGAQQLPDFCAAILASPGAAPTISDKKPKQSKPRPFEARIEFTEMFSKDAPAICRGGLLGTVDGTGNATHLGQTELYSENCAFGDGTFLGFFGLDVKLTAANGDVVRAKYCGIALPQPSAPGQNTIHGGYVITGGTGRFEGATGSGIISGMETLVFPPGSPYPYMGRANIVLNGNISY